jgi:predicted branched-subunit amino acid permease
VLEAIIVVQGVAWSYLPMDGTAPVERVGTMISRVRADGIAGRWWSPTVRDSLGIGLATGTYGLSFGALSAAAGLSVPQTVALAVLMFTGASQFAFVGVLAAGGTPVAAAATALLLGSRNGLYGLHLSRLLGLRGWRRPVGAHLVIDESAGMAVRHAEGAPARTAFWATGLAVFGCWNAATLLGALGAHALANPGVLGLDVVAPAAFLALLAPRLRTLEAWLVALAAGAVAFISTPFVPAGVPVLLAALPAVAWALAPIRRRGNGAGGEQGGEPGNGAGGGPGGGPGGGAVGCCGPGPAAGSGAVRVR